VLAVVAVALGLLYPLLGMYSRMFVETGRLNTIAAEPLTLDGGTTLIGNGDDYQAVMCLNPLVQGDDAVVVESVGNSYHGENGRTATLAGIPVVFNWPFHEMQWRGGTFGELSGTRQGDIDLLYGDHGTLPRQSSTATALITSFSAPANGSFMVPMLRSSFGTISRWCANAAAVATIVWAT
jgi:uncharacterized membrane protein